jgi:hypothetical protein
MPNSVYVCLQDEDKIAAFAMDGDTGHLTPQAEVPAAGGPSVMALSPDPAHAVCRASHPAHNLEFPDRPR